MKALAPQTLRLAPVPAAPQNAAPRNEAAAPQNAVGDLPAGNSLAHLQQEGAVRAQQLKTPQAADPDSNPATPREHSAKPHEFHGTPQNLKTLPPEVSTGGKKPPLAPHAKRSRVEQAALPAARTLGRNLQLEPRAGDEDIFSVQPAGQLPDRRDAFNIDGTSGARTVAGKAVQFDGRHYVYLEKNIGNPGAPKYVHGGVLEKSADGTWRVRRRYVPAMSLSLAARFVNLPRSEIKHLEKMVADGQLNDFFRAGDFRGVLDIADHWTESYPRRIADWGQDAKRFGNHEGKLPIEQSTLELTCRDDRFKRGEVRLVLDQQGHLLFTPDHYRSFILLTPSSPARVHLNALPMAVRSSPNRVFDPHHVANFLLGQRVKDIRGMFDKQDLSDGQVAHPLQAISQSEFERLQSDLGRNLLPGFSLNDCSRIRGTGMVVALPRSQDGSLPPRVFVEGYVGTRFSEVVPDKGTETPLNYFKV